MPSEGTYKLILTTSNHMVIAGDYIPCYNPNLHLKKIITNTNI